MFTYKNNNNLLNESLFYKNVDNRDKNLSQDFEVKTFVTFDDNRAAKPWKIAGICKVDPTKCFSRIYFIYQAAWDEYIIIKVTLTLS